MTTEAGFTRQAAPRSISESERQPSFLQALHDPLDVRLVLEGHPANALGERVGNTPMELMLVNLRLMGLIYRDLSRLKEYCEKVAVATHTTIPPNYPVIGHDAFRTATGHHRCRQ